MVENDTCKLTDAVHVIIVQRYLIGQINLAVGGPIQGWIPFWTCSLQIFTAAWSSILSYISGELVNWNNGAN